MGGTSVAVDGGQSGMRAVAVGGPGAGRCVAGRGFVWQPGADAVAGTVADVVALVTRLDRTGADRTGMDRIMLGLTSAPADVAARRRLAGAVRDALGAAEVWVSGDMVTAHAGALAGADGVVVAAGTGAVTLAVHSGRTAQVDGHGYLLGDDGSAFALGRSGLRAALRAGDGRGPATALADAMTGYLADLGTDDPYDLYRQPHPVAAVAGFARAVTAAADTDPVAADLVDRAARALAESARAAVEPLPGPVAVSYCGGVFAAPAVLDRFRAALAADCPRAQVRPPRGDPLAGAVHLIEHGIARYGGLVTVVTA